jgi:hypothetical protein
LVATRSADGRQYRLSSGVVAPFGVRRVAACEARYGFAKPASDVLAGLTGATPTVPFASGTQVAWRRRWEAPVASLQQLARDRCEVAAALRFMRTPVWEVSGSTLALADARYGVRGGFNAVAFPAASACTLTGKWLPPWTPPRRDLLGTGPTR